MDHPHLISTVTYIKYNTIQKCKHSMDLGTFRGKMLNQTIFSKTFWIFQATNSPIDLSQYTICMPKKMIWTHYIYHTKEKV